MDSRTREFFATPECIQYIIASAIVLNNPAAFILAKAFLSFNKPPIITELFTNPQKALEWLKQFRPVMY